MFDLTKLCSNLFILTIIIKLHFVYTSLQTFENYEMKWKQMVDFIINGEHKIVSSNQKNSLVFSFFYSVCDDDVVMNTKSYILFSSCLVCRDDDVVTNTKSYILFSLCFGLIFVKSYATIGFSSNKVFSEKVVYYSVCKLWAVFFYTIFV